MRTVSSLAVVAASVAVVACGQKGPLVHPDAQHPHKKLAVPKTAAPPTSQPGAPAADPTIAPTPQQ